VVERLELACQAAKQRGDVLDHVLLSGPPGLGKTTLAYILAEGHGVNIKTASGLSSQARRPGGPAHQLEKGDVLFIDEIHRMQKAVEEYLYAAMEDFFIDIMIDQGRTPGPCGLELPRFHADRRQTRSGLLSSPLRSRFGLDHRLDYYAPRTSRPSSRGPPASSRGRRGGGALEIAGRRAARPHRKTSCGACGLRADPGRQPHTRAVADRALEMLDIDRHGLDEMDKRIIETISSSSPAGPVASLARRLAVG